jgi:kynurenine formamidase
MSEQPRIVDLSHAIVDGMVTHPGIPAPTITTWLSHEESTGRYAPGTTFEIARIDMVANTGTYIDIIDRRREASKAIGPDAFPGVDLRGRAVLIATGWDAYWGTESYLADNPFLTEDASRLLAEAGARLVGIDSLNIDSILDPRRPAHTTLLGAGIPIVEHLTGLDALPTEGWRFFAVPPRVRGMATFPVRAFAIVP